MEPLERHVLEGRFGAARIEPGAATAVGALAGFEDLGLPFRMEAALLRTAVDRAQSHVVDGPTVSDASIDAYAAFGTGDVSQLTAMFSDDIRWHVSGESPVAGDYVGTEGVLSFFGAMMALYDWTLQVEPVEFSSVHVFSLSGGKITSFESFQDDRYDRFWSKHALSV